MQPTELHVIKCNDGYDLGMDNTKKFTEGNKDVLINYIYMDLHITRWNSDQKLSVTVSSASSFGLLKFHPSCVFPWVC